MKRILFLIPILLLLTGCGKSNIMECTIKSLDSFTDYKFEAKYMVYKDGDYVKTVTANEKYTTDDINTLKALEEQAKAQYKEYNNKYNGYVYSFKISGNTLESKVVINYDIMDYNKYLQDNPVMQSYSKNNRFTVEGAKAMYALLGATCK